MLLIRLLAATIIIAGLLLPGIISGKASAATADDVVILCYHDVGEKGTGLTVTKQTLHRHFTLLKENGYHPISLDAYIDALDGKTALPDKPVLLTFDDGYISFYNEVFPLLRQFNYPAMLALVTGWQQAQPPRDIGTLVDWNQVRELEGSGLVSIASHTHDLHHMIPMNPFGDMGHAVSSREYRQGQYESLEAYQQRIRGDFFQTQQVFSRELGHPVRALVWPYGEYTEYAVQAAKAAGFKVFFTLGDDVSGSNRTLAAQQRLLLRQNPDDQSFLYLLARFKRDPQPLKVGQLDIDMIYSPSRAQLETNLDDAIYQMKKAGITTVFLQAFNDMLGTGNIQEVYFYTAAAPVKADIFSHITLRLREAGFKVYAWIPTLSGQWLLERYPDAEVTASNPQHQGWYRRATPFSPQVREALKQMVRDLAAFNPIDGILFQDDLYLNDFEDISLPARAAFRAKFNRELSAEALKQPDIAREWARLKATALTNLTKELSAEVWLTRPLAKTARNIYSAAVLDPGAVSWLAQDFSDYLATYDYTVIMAYPYLDRAKQPREYLRGLATAALSHADSNPKVIFKLQSYDWSTKTWIPVKDLAEQVSTLKSLGAANIGYYPIHLYSSSERKLPF
ncbi:MAG: poly-beta-1,6-N-acetyl-D-glucosamine N-deacetylase PgaB [Negativicutes bacterium]|nr:poly-beta-1,6-N-acetyl-D-glucosamine N-deacetylase PgaB [Negativicutes bacterium]